jgi:hypothetical protein
MRLPIFTCPCSSKLRPTLSGKFLIGSKHARVDSFPVIDGHVGNDRRKIITRSDDDSIERPIEIIFALETTLRRNDFYEESSGIDP